MKITAIEPFVCDGGLREFGFLKVTTDEGIVGWAETYDWHTSASLATALRVMGRRADRRGPAPDRAHERADLVRRPAGRPRAGQGPRRDRSRPLGHQGEVARACPVYELLGGRFRDRIPLYWSHFASYRALWPEVVGAEPDVHLRGLGGRRAGRRRRRGSRSSRRTSSRRRAGGGPPTLPTYHDGAIDRRTIDEAVKWIGTLRDVVGPGIGIARGRPVRLPDGRDRPARPGARAVRPVLARGRVVRSRTRCSRRASRRRRGCATANR